MEPSSIAQLFGLTEVPIDKGYQVVRQEVYDADLYSDVISDSPVLQDTVVRGSELLATFDHLLQDIFVSLFKLEPELLPIEEVAEKVEFNRSLMEAFYGSEDFERLRAMTQLDPLASALGTQVLGEKALQQLFHQDDTPEDTGNGLADIAATACQVTVDEVMNLMGQARSWGLEPGDPNLRVSFQSKRRALERLRSSPSLQQLSQLIGRFKLLAREVFRKKGSDGSTTIRATAGYPCKDQVLPIADRSRVPGTADAVAWSLVGPPDAVGASQDPVALVPVQLQPGNDTGGMSGSGPASMAGHGTADRGRWLTLYGHSLICSGHL